MSLFEVLNCHINLSLILRFLIISLQFHLQIIPSSSSPVHDFPHHFPHRCVEDENTKCESHSAATSDSPKLLIILIDGFRWDYYNRQKGQLPGLSYFLSDGVHASYVDPIFPSMSFPSWTTIATGVYPENHNILGNYMLHIPQNSDDEEMVFQLIDNSTKSPFWWKDSPEPIWATATKNGQKVYLANWARCDVPFDGVLPTECTGYSYQDVNKAFRSDLLVALKRLKSGYSLAMVYDDFIDHVGHKFGPDSPELLLAMVQRDTSIHELLMSIQLSGLTNKINVVLTSDHGMTSLNKDVKRVFLSEYINEDDVYRVVDYGSVVQLQAMPNRTEALGKSLGNITGVAVYEKSEIPEALHYKEGLNVLDFLLVAQPGYFIVGIKGEKQIPHNNKASSAQPYNGVHGYHDMADMRTVFYAKGPAFKKGLTHPPIKLVDEYQIFMRVLGLTPNANKGKWDSVVDMLK